MNAIERFRMSKRTFVLDELIRELQVQPTSSKPKCSNELLLLLSYFRTIERLVMVEYADNIRKMPSYFIPPVAEFLEEWEDEETRHGVALEELLRIRGHQLPSITKADATWKYRVKSGLFIVISWIFWFVSPGVHMIVGLINEITTKTGYWALMKQVNDAQVRKVIAAIQAEEIRHMNFYAEMATELLSTPFKRWAAKILLDLAWTPVGSNNLDAKVFAKTLLAERNISDKFFGFMQKKLKIADDIIAGVSPKVLIGLRDLIT